MYYYTHFADCTKVPRVEATCPGVTADLLSPVPPPSWHFLLETFGDCLKERATTTDLGSLFQEPQSRPAVDPGSKWGVSSGSQEESGSRSSTAHLPPGLSGELRAGRGQAGHRLACLPGL